MKVTNDHGRKFSNLSIWKEEARKNQSFNGIRTRDLHDTGATELWSHTDWEQGTQIDLAPD